MANTFIIKEAIAERVPFLRGLLVQSLVTARLSLQGAYALARVLRSKPQNAEEVTTAGRRTRAFACSNL